VNRLPLLLLLFIGLAIAACGQSDSDKRKGAEQVVRDFVRATNSHDADAICGRLLTQEFLERTTGGMGEGAQRACRSQLHGVRGLEIRLVRMGSVRLHGDRATVRAVLVAQGRPGERVFDVVREDGDWKLAGARGG
jgi:hypothetical protein